MAPSNPRTVVIADDHGLVRSGMKEILARIPDVEVVAEAENGLEAISMAKEHRPTLLLLDAGMPLSRGMEVYGEVRRWTPDTRIAVVTGLTSTGSLSDWIAAGVDGLLLKSCPPEEMLAGFTLLLEGEGYVAKEVLSRLEAGDTAADLTPRERQILHLIAEGRSNKEMADRLSISAKTVDNHRTKLMAKLGVHSLAELLALALREGLLDASSQL